MTDLNKLIEEVGRLTEATTDLLDTTTVSKATLDAAVASAGEDAAAAASGAEVATTQASAANTSAGKAKTEADRAKKEADNAAAVVTGGTAALEPAPGKIPIADSKGHINAGWTPLLTAMYPYSGVIGSVNKGDMFAFKADDAGDSNKFTVKKSQFNINGKFVDKAQGVITLPDAEDTAARAVAFDDIFLDWNGTVTSHRSITPHRTGSSYDRDAIATEHGYSKVQTGLYKVGSTYSLLLGRVARRNQGAYHPVFNSEGTATVYFTDAGESRYPWFNSKAEPLNSIADCFDRGSYGVNKVPEHSGQISLGFSGRPGAKYDGTPQPSGTPWFYDAIYADDFTPLYYSAKNVIDRQALLFDSFNKAVAGETFSGAEGVSRSTLIVNTTYTASGGGVSFINNTGLPQGQHYGLAGTGTSVSLYFHRIDRTITTNYGIYSNGPQSGFSIGALGDTSNIRKDDLVTITSDYPLLRTFFAGINQSPSARPQLLMVDIIGSLDAMPDEWKTEGIPGNWLAVGEEGEDLTPDGTAKNYKMSRKCLEAYQVLRTDDKGVTWSDVTSTYKTDIEGATNSMGSQSFAATYVFMVFYKVSANPFELSGRGNVLGYGWGAYISDQSMGTVVSNVLNKVPTSTDYFQFQPELLKGGSTITHKAFTGLTVTNPSVKVQGALSHDSNVYALKAYYKELKHNGTQWGDDNKFDIVDKQSTVTDLNGEDVIVGQKRVELPYQFDGVTY